MSRRRTGRGQPGVAPAALLCAALLCSAVPAAAEPTAAEPPAPDVPAAEPTPIVWSVDDWHIEAADARMRDGWWVLEDAVARRGGWQLRADRLELRLRPDRWRWVAAMRAQGQVRLQGPDELYAAADRAVSLRPATGVAFVEAVDAAPWLVVDAGRFVCASIWLGWATGEVELDGLVAQGAF